MQDYRDIDITEYMNHLPTCNTQQNWLEAEQALADSPEGPDKQMAYQEMIDKKNTCTCGYKELVKTLRDQIGALLLDREIFDSFQEGETMKIVTTRIQTMHSSFRVDLKFVAVKGGADDWAIYCHFPYQSDEFVKTNGDKVVGRGLIQSLCPCTPEILDRYRF